MEYLPGLPEERTNSDFFSSKASIYILKTPGRTIWMSEISSLAFEWLNILDSVFCVQRDDEIMRKKRFPHRHPLSTSSSLKGVLSHREHLYRPRFGDDFDIGFQIFRAKRL